MLTALLNCFYSGSWRLERNPDNLCSVQPYQPGGVYGGGGVYLHRRQGYIRLRISFPTLSRYEVTLDKNHINMWGGGLNFGNNFPKEGPIWNRKTTAYNVGLKINFNLSNEHEIQQLCSVKYNDEFHFIS